MKTRFISLLFVAGLTFSTRAYSAEPEVEARFKRGVELYNEADFRSAVIEFRKAYEKGKNAKILYNIAQCEYQLTNYVAALDAFERYLAEGGAQVTAERRTEIEAELTKLRARISRVTIHTNVSGAAIRVDDQSIGTAPLPAALPMNPGSHRIVVHMDGWRDASKVVEVGGGDTPTLELTLVEEPREQPSAPTPARSGRSWTPAIIGWSAAGIFAAGGIVLGLAARSKSDSLSDAKNSPTTSASELRDLDSSTRTLALLTDISFGAAILSAGFATYFTIDALGSPSRSGSMGSGRATLRISPTVGGIQCAGAF